MKFKFDNFLVDITHTDVGAKYLNKIKRKFFNLHQIIP